MTLKEASKAALRKQFRELRKNILPKEREVLSAKICQRVWRELISPRVALQKGPSRFHVGLYYPMDAEVDVRFLAQKLNEQGVPMALPVLDSEPVFFRAVQNISQVDLSRRIPAPAADLPEARPSILIVPGVAFSRDGYRLGFGSGFFDRTIAALRVPPAPPPLCVGVCFHAQLVASLPREPHDVPMDAIMTESESLRLSPQV